MSTSKILLGFLAGAVAGTAIGIFLLLIRDLKHAGKLLMRVRISLIT